MIILASMLGRSLVSVNFPVPMTKYLTPPKKISLSVEKIILDTVWGHSSSQEGKAAGASGSR